MHLKFLGYLFIYYKVKNVGHSFFAVFPKLTFEKGICKFTCLKIENVYLRTLITRK